MKVCGEWIIHVERVSQRVHVFPVKDTQITHAVVAEVNLNIGKLRSMQEGFRCGTV